MDGQPIMIGDVVRRNGKLGVVTMVIPDRMVGVDFIDYAYTSPTFAPMEWVCRPGGRLIEGETP